jgi:hypothetical protein
MNKAPAPIQAVLSLLYDNPKKVEHLVDSLKKQQDPKEESKKKELKPLNGILKLSV